LCCSYIVINNKSTILVKIHLIGFIWALTIIYINLIFLHIVDSLTDILYTLDGLTRQCSDYME